MLSLTPKPPGAMPQGQEDFGIAFQAIDAGDHSQRPMRMNAMSMESILSNEAMNVDKTTSAHSASNPSRIRTSTPLSGVGSQGVMGYRNEGEDGIGLINPAIDDIAGVVAHAQATAGTHHDNDQEMDDTPSIPRSGMEMDIDRNGERARSSSRSVTGQDTAHIIVLNQAPAPIPFSQGTPESSTTNQARRFNPAIPARTAHPSQTPISSRSYIASPSTSSGVRSTTTQVQRSNPSQNTQLPNSGRAHTIPSIKGVQATRTIADFPVASAGGLAVRSASERNIDGGSGMRLGVRRTGLGMMIDVKAGAEKNGSVQSLTHKQNDQYVDVDKVDSAQVQNLGDIYEVAARIQHHQGEEDKMRAASAAARASSSSLRKQGVATGSQTPREIKAPAGVPASLARSGTVPPKSAAAEQISMKDILTRIAMDPMLSAALKSEIDKATKSKNKDPQLASSGTQKPARTVTSRNVSSKSIGDGMVYPQHASSTLRQPPAAASNVDPNFKFPAEAAAVPTQHSIQNPTAVVSSTGRETAKMCQEAWNEVSMGVLEEYTIFKEHQLHLRNLMRTGAGTFYNVRQIAHSTS